MVTNLVKLLETLDEIILLLESDGEQHWSTWIRQSRERLQSSDCSGIEHFRSAYGGMGSFNDLIICQNYENGKFYWEDGHVEKNNRLNELRGKAWELADEIWRNRTKSNS
jgi:hypothetical protein